MKKFAKAISIFLLLITTMFVMTACVPSSPQKAREKLEDDRYTVYDLPVDYLDDAIDGFWATKYENETSHDVTVYYFKTVKAAKEYYEFEKEFSTDDYVKRWGKCVYTGNKDGIKDFRK
ncbi:MAG: hypothetical protein IJA97_00940 [Clostridia bacterium]|nr:hypothetical protein [Clostridia bacterium]